MGMKMMIKCIFVLKSCILSFCSISSFFHFKYFSFSYLRKFFVFSIYGVNNYQDCKQYVGAGKNTLMSISDGLGPSIFLSKDEKGASYQGIDGWKSCLIPARVGISDFDVIVYEVLFPICNSTSRVKNYVSCQEKV